MKLVISLLPLLLVLCNGVVVPDELKEATKKFLDFFATEKKASTEALEFLDNVFVEMANYRCAVGGDDCAALRVS